MRRATKSGEQRHRKENGELGMTTNTEIGKIISSTRVDPFPKFGNEELVAFEYLVTALGTDPRDAYNNLDIDLDVLYIKLSELAGPDNVSKNNWGAVKGQISFELGAASNVRLLFGNTHNFIQDVFIGKTQLLGYVGTTCLMEEETPVTFDFLGILKAIVAFFGSIFAPEGGSVISSIFGGIVTLAEENWNGTSIDKVEAKYAELYLELNKSFNLRLTNTEKMAAAVLTDCGKLRAINSLIEDGTLNWPADHSEATKQAETQYEIGLWQTMIPIRHHIGYLWEPNVNDTGHDYKECPCVGYAPGFNPSWVNGPSYGPSVPKKFCARLVELGVDINTVVYNLDGKWPLDSKYTNGTYSRPPCPWDPKK